LIIIEKEDSDIPRKLKKEQFIAKIL